MAEPVGTSDGISPAMEAMRTQLKRERQTAEAIEEASKAIEEEKIEKVSNVANAERGQIIDIKA